MKFYKLWFTVIAPILFALAFAMVATSAWADHSIVITLKQPRAPAGEARAREIRQGLQAVMRVLGTTSYTVKRTYEEWGLPYLAVTVDDHGLELLEAATEITGFVKDYEFFTQLGQAVPFLGADKAHAAGFKGRGYSVAIIDTGLDLGHSEFKDAAGNSRIVAEACFTDGPQCPNGQDTMIGPGAGAAIASHGTHVAGICCGKAGIAPEASLIAVQVFTRRSNGGISASFSDIIAGLAWVSTQRNVAAASMSLGTGPIIGDCSAQFQAVRDASQLVINSGGIVSSAAGNNGSSTGLSAPACIDNNTSIGCTATLTDAVCSFSNRGPLLDMWAPGLSIRSANQGGGTSVKSGTSMSTPMVAGAAALVRQMFPSIGSAANVITTLKFFGTKVAGVPRLRIDNLGFGQPPPPPPPDPNTPPPPDPNQPGQCADADGDGEQDSRDRCPDTPAGEEIDDAGCSHKQWCSTIVPGTWRLKGDCKALDFGNNEPRRAADCRLERHGWGPSDDECVPR